MDQGLGSIVTAALEALGGAGKEHGIEGFREFSNQRAVTLTSGVA